MCDKLVFDLAQEVEGSPAVFVRKDWLNILDNQNQNYNNNQSVIDTSQLSNSNKYMSYREAYFSIPFLISLATTSAPTVGKDTTAGPASTITGGGTFAPATSGTSADFSIGLKNWFGQIIHSFTLDYNGTTIIQQTPYINMWNSFKLMTSLSLDDINTQGATIGFYPDDPLTWAYTPPDSLSTYGQGTTNNTDYDNIPIVSGAFNSYKTTRGNLGFRDRQYLINFDTAGVTGGATTTGTYASLIRADAVTQCWKSYITKKQNQTFDNSTKGVFQMAVVATVYLKHIHSFFNMCPLLKGVFMKMTMNLNNTVCDIKAISSATGATTSAPLALACTAISNPLGGINPLMVAAGSASNGGLGLFNTAITGGTVDGWYFVNYRLAISVGGVCLDSTLVAAGCEPGTLSKSVYLYIPAYTFNPVFEQAYLSSPVKQIKYTDVYQYQVLNIAPAGNFNNLLTNGIANVKSVLVLPFYSSTAGSASSVASALALKPADQFSNNSNTGFAQGYPVFQSPFDPAGTGPTSPMCWLSNFNIQVSGQNAIYNVERYNFEQFNNQLYGQNAVNGGLTDGLTSGLISRQSFDMEYCYYYVNVERMLPVEMSVPKSIQILGQNYSSKAIDSYCFIEYGCEISIDDLTGARV